MQNLYKFGSIETKIWVGFTRFESYREYNIILIYSFRGGMESSILEYEDKTTVKIPAKLIFFMVC